MSCYRQQVNKFSKMKVHWRNYNHCLFISYLASVTFGYGWILDTKFKKLSDKDLIWICKNFLDMDQELKNQYPLTFAVHPKHKPTYIQNLNKIPEHKT